jgi:uncharacterized protein (TIGR00725 family)
MKVTFFGGAMDKKDTQEYLDTIEIAKILGEKGYTIKSGGYRGIMEAASKGGSESGTNVIGYTCATFPSTVGNDYLNETVVSKDIYDRLRHLIEDTDLYIVQRGGPGTLSELFLTLDVIRKRKVKPKILLIGSYWNRVLENISLLISEKDLSLLTVINDIEHFKQWIRN